MDGKALQIEEGQDFLAEIRETMGCDIAPCTKEVNLNDEKIFEKLLLTTEQKMILSELGSHLPNVASTGLIANAYSIKFSKGKPHILMKNKKMGGYTTTIVNEKHEIQGHAALFQMNTQALILGAFTAMSVATGQFFLAQINKELRTISKKLDEILDFLYGEKRAELLSEVNFVKQAYRNYGSIMGHEVQRIATIGSLQEAKKVAMKDIEFYEKCMADKIDDVKEIKYFSDIVKKDSGDLGKISENLELSLQLYLLSGLMEVYYSQNFDETYLDNLQLEINTYVKKCYEQLVEGYISKLHYLLEIHISICLNIILLPMICHMQNF